MHACRPVSWLHVSLCRFDDGEYFRFNTCDEGRVLRVAAKHLALARRPICSRTIILGSQPGCSSELLLPSPSYRWYLVCVTLGHQIVYCM